MMKIPDNYPICVDLDGTLIFNDVTQIAIRKFVKKSWLNAVKVLFWFLHGRAFLKNQLAKKIALDITDLYVNKTVLDILKKKKKLGAKIYLATACSNIYAEYVTANFSIFDGYFASDKNINLRATAKAYKLIEVFGEKNFIYFGNSKDDLKIWEHAFLCVAVNTKGKTYKKLLGKRSLKSVIKIE